MDNAKLRLEAASLPAEQQQRFMPGLEEDQEQVDVADFLGAGRADGPPEQGGAAGEGAGGQRAEGEELAEDPWDAFERAAARRRAEAAESGSLGADDDDEL